MLSRAYSTFHEARFNHEIYHNTIKYKARPPLSCFLADGDKYIPSLSASYHNPLTPQNIYGRARCEANPLSDTPHKTPYRKAILEPTIQKLLRVLELGTLVSCHEEICARIDGG
jgi:hypothetical protein